MPPQVDVTGHCYCGAIQFAVHIPAGDQPIFTAYCHCDSCRRAHAAPLYHVACVDQSHFEITAGAEPHESVLDLDLLRKHLELVGE